MVFWKKLFGKKSKEYTEEGLKPVYNSASDKDPFVHADSVVNMLGTVRLRCPSCLEVTFVDFEDELKRLIWEGSKSRSVMNENINWDCKSCGDNYKIYQVPQEMCDIETANQFIKDAFEDNDLRLKIINAKNDTLVEELAKEKGYTLFGNTLKLAIQGINVIDK